MYFGDRFVELRVRSEQPAFCIERRDDRRFRIGAVEQLSLLQVDPENVEKVGCYMHFLRIAYFSSADRIGIDYESILRVTASVGKTPASECDGFYAGIAFDAFL